MLQGRPEEVRRDSQKAEPEEAVETRGSHNEGRDRKQQRQIQRAFEFLQTENEVQGKGITAEERDGVSG